MLDVGLPKSVVVRIHHFHSPSIHSADPFFFVFFSGFHGLQYIFIRMLVFPLFRSSCHFMLHPHRHWWHRFCSATSIITQSKMKRQAATVKVNKGASWGVGSMLLVYTLIYDLTVGPVCYAIVAETSSTHLRQKTIVLARMTYNICGVINNVPVPLILNPGAWNWGAKTGLFWAGICAIRIVWCFFRLPDTKGVHATSSPSSLRIVLALTSSRQARWTLSARNRLLACRMLVVTRCPRLCIRTPSITNISQTRLGVD